MAFKERVEPVDEITDPVIQPGDVEEYTAGAGSGYVEDDEQEDDGQTVPDDQAEPEDQADQADESAADENEGGSGEDGAEDDDDDDYITADDAGVENSSEQNETSGVTVPEGANEANPIVPESPATTEYKSGFARALSKLGGVFGEGSALSNFINRLADKVEQVAQANGWTDEDEHDAWNSMSDEIAQRTATNPDADVAAEIADSRAETLTGEVTGSATGAEQAEGGEAETAEDDGAGSYESGEAGQSEAEQAENGETEQTENTGAEDAAPSGAEPEVGQETEPVIFAENSEERLSAEEFVSGLHDYAEKIRNGDETAMSAIQEWANVDVSKNDPVWMITSLRMFSAMGEGYIGGLYADHESPEYLNAMADLATCNVELTGAAYETMYTAECSGMMIPLDADNLGTISHNSSNIYGVEVPYDLYYSVEGVHTDITVPLPEDQDELDQMFADHELYIMACIDERTLDAREAGGTFLKSSPGIMYANADEGTTSQWRMDAMRACESGAFITTSFAEENADFTVMHVRGCDDLHNFRDYIEYMPDNMDNAPTADEIAAGAEPLTPDQTKNGQWMNYMAGLQAYNDQAVAEINKRYEVGSDDYNRAVDGLGKTMRYATGMMFGALQADNDAADGRILSEDDIKLLDQMQLTGVNVSFSEYEPGMDLLRGPEIVEGYENEEDPLYGVDDDIDYGDLGDGGAEAPEAGSEAEDGYVVETNDAPNIRDTRIRLAQMLMEKLNLYNGVQTEDQSYMDR